MMLSQSGKVCVPAALCLGSRNTEYGSGLRAMAPGGRTDLRLAESIPALRVRYEKRADIHEAFLSFGCALICWRFLRVDWVAG